MPGLLFLYTNEKLYQTMEKRFLGLIERSIKEHWDLPAFSDYNGITYHYGDVARQIAKLHLLLHEAGVRPGDKVALLGRNSSNWAICFFGVLAYGAVAVPILHDFKADNVHHIVNHAEAKVLLAAAHNWQGLDAGQMPHVHLFVKLDDMSIIQCKEESVNSLWQQIDTVMQQRYPNGYGRDELLFHQEQPDELAVLNYTSGTTSFSKGVMIPFRSLWSNTQFAYDNLPFIHPGDNIVCLLPMAHMYGLAFEILNSFNKGCHVHFLPRVPVPKIMAEAFVRIRPTLVLAVPLIIEKIIRNKIFPQLEKPAVKWLLKVPFVRGRIRALIAHKLEEAFGGRISEVVIGGAALNKEVESFLQSIHFKYTVGYGMTECGPLVSYAQWDRFKPGSVGQVVDRMEIKIDDPNAEGIGEVLVRGMNTMLGYYKNPEATEAVMLPDGWMRTGDLGLIDQEGHLFLKGRSKTMILGANGQNIYPEEIEDRLNNMPYVGESLIISEAHKLIALVYPDPELMEKQPLRPEEIEKQMQENIKQLNVEMPAYCKVSEFRLQQQEFEKTPKRSIKRYLYQKKEA